MGLDNDIYACLNADWDVSIIAKPKFHLNEQEPRAQTRHFHINAEEKGTFVELSSDNTADEKRMPFILTFFEGNEDDAVKTLRSTKKALHQKDVSSGYYHIDDFQIIEDNQLTTGILIGNFIKIIGDSEF